MEAPWTVNFGVYAIIAQDNASVGKAAADSVITALIEYLRNGYSAWALK